MINPKKNYITPTGYQKLVDERDLLVKTERPEVTKVVSWAASLGDRSENADYQYGKKKLREIDRRLRFLNTKINTAVVVDPETQTGERVQFGATVTIEDEEGNTKMYSIVGQDEIDPKAGLISWKSPIAQALLGKEVGDEVDVIGPQGIISFEIAAIDYKKIDGKE